MTQIRARWPDRIIEISIPFLVLFAMSTESLSDEVLRHAVPRDEFVIQDVLVRPEAMQGRKIRVYGYLSHSIGGDGSKSIRLVPFPELSNAPVGESINFISILLEFSSDAQFQKTLECGIGFAAADGTIELSGSSVLMKIERPDDGVIRYEGGRKLICA